ncbi:MAG: sugar phosphate nucleotidyltransferase, partial [Chloroflexi bacterium]|nr:sugar phosphate nucleotidyltransferase [Chloroflexota bacterium]
MNQGAFPVAILAGGLATRLQPLTQTIPKALVDVNGEPFVAHQLRLLRANGVERVVVCAGYLGKMIQDFVGDGSRFALHVDFSFDGSSLLGTAGAVKNALPLMGDLFFVLYGDSYLPCDYRVVQAEFVKSGKPALMTVFRNEGLSAATTVF